MRNTIWNAARKFTLGIAVVAGLFTVGTVSAKAAPIQFEVGFSGRPACPGDGYVWVDSYYNGNYWVPGAWVFQGYGGGYGYRAEYGYRNNFRFDHERSFDPHPDRNFGGSRDRNWDHREDRGGDRHFDDRRNNDRGHFENHGLENRGGDRNFGGDHHSRR